MLNKKSNKLIFEKSPYLLQHAYNPVNWFPWGEEAFEKAKKEDKPIFLSIGYSTCHWCHVMEKESFEDDEVAKLLNETFICIKVDREERPDIDSIYMKICQLITDSGGWPLHVFMTATKKPFFATTYIPKESRFGRAGMKELIPQIKTLWKSRRDELIGSAEKIIALISQTESTKMDLGEKIGSKTLNSAYKQLSNSFDEKHGGFSIAPKFPAPHNLSFLLRYWKRKSDEKAIWMVEKTLKAIRLGGIYDHIGFGFHRYSTDSEWLVPHFEKMLYDQAMLTIAYTEAYQATKKEAYKQTVNEIITYVLCDMASTEGGFYSSQDADSDGEEGKFYVWKEEEINQILSKSDAELLIKVYNIEEEGNFEDEATRKRTGKNILYLKTSLSEVAMDLSIPVNSLQKRLEKIRRTLLDVREKRTRLHKDDKILTDWNGLMIAALAKAARVFEHPEYTEAGVKATNFLLKNMFSDENRLFHRYRDKKAGIKGFLDDYAFFVWGLLELYETTLKVSYLQYAIMITKKMIMHFWDEEHGGFYFTAKDAEKILFRKKEVYDGAYPSGNSVALLNLLRLARITANTEFEEKAAQMLDSFSNIISKAPASYNQFLIALDFALGPSYEVVIVGKPQRDDTEKMIKALRKMFIPNKVVLFKPTGLTKPEITQFAEFTKSLFAKEGKATAYICRDFKCDLPTTEVQRMTALLNNDKKSTILA